MPGLDWLIARPIAHRGLHGNGIAENTLAAASAAVSANYGIEVDLLLSGDGEVMVFHDDTLDRLTEAQGPVSARTLAELKKLTIGGTGERMPTLDELLETVAGKVPLVLELKSDWDGDRRLAARVAERLAGYAGPVAAMSFDPEAVDALRELAPGLPRGIVAERHYRDPEWHALSWQQKFALGNLAHAMRTKPHFVAYYAKELPALAPLIARHLFGLKLLTWTVRSEQERSRVRWWANQIIFEGFRPRTP